MKIRKLIPWLCFSVVMLTVAGCKKSSAGNEGVPTISVQPKDQTVTAGQTATFSVTASGAGTLTYQWFKNGVSISGANGTSFTTAILTTADSKEFFFVYISNSVGSVESDVVILTVNAATSAPTSHSDNARTSLNPKETILAPGNVNPAGFGKIGFFPVDGAVDAQPLYLSEVTVPGKGVHNILYVATENDTVFALDAFSGAVLWRTNVAGAGETPGDNSSCNPESPNAGVSATPVIDRARGPNGAIYLIAKSRDSAGISYERMHALDVSTGTELFGGPTTIPVSLSGGAPAFDAAILKAQAGLVASNGHVYASWTAPCSSISSTSSALSGGGAGWIVAFDAGNLAIAGTLNIRLSNLKGIGSLNGGTLPADATGNLFLAGIGSIQLPTTGTNALGLVSDSSIAAGPVLLLPDLTDQSGKVWRLAVNVGADGNVYVLDREAQVDTGLASNGVVSGIVQRLDGAIPSGAAPAGLAYFNNTVYISTAGGGVRAFSVANARLSPAPASQTSGTLGQGGGSISVSAHDSANAILWVLEGGDAAVLHAYDAADLSHEFFNSGQAQDGRDGFGPSNTPAMPLVINGRVYVITTNGVAVFGLLK